MKAETGSYAQAGVDRGRAAEAIARVSRLAARTQSPQVLAGVGPFAAVWRLGPDLPRDAVLVSSTDSVGTKTKVAVAMGRHRGIGSDLVNHCVNDVLTTGAEPLFFLDYFAAGRIEPAVLEELAEGMSQACLDAGCSLVGGETAEMPGVYGLGDYDLAGFLVGCASEAEVLGPRRVEAGDRLLGFASTGLHTNGFSLVRQLLTERDLGYDEVLPGTQRPVGELLLEIHASYLAPVRALRALGPVHALAHITGGGLVENLPRALPGELCAEVDRDSWTIPALITALARLGEIPEDELWGTFNMGVGMVAVVPAETARAALSDPDMELFEIGEVVPRRGPDRVRLS
ncbi:MAG: phosphoribosylformylglycinamidine cyclo-ligase [Candidatus Dormibacteria bacterium]